MSDEKDFVTGIDSNARKTPRRVAFITRRTSAQVKVTDAGGAVRALQTLKL